LSGGNWGISTREAFLSLAEAMATFLNIRNVGGKTPLFKGHYFILLPGKTEQMRKVPMIPFYFVSVG